MSDNYELSAEVRLQLGKGANRRMRKNANQTPAVVYGINKKPVPITLNSHQLVNALKNEAFYSHILTIMIDKTPEKVILKALHRHPSKPQILHADFLRVSATEKLQMNVPLHFINEEAAPGVKLEAGKISHLMNEVEIRCLPADLPEYIEVDLAALKLGEAIHLSEISLPKGVEIVALSHEDDRAVVNIHAAQVNEEPELVAPTAEVPLVGENEDASEGESKTKS